MCVCVENARRHTHKIPNRILAFSSHRYSFKDGVHCKHADDFVAEETIKPLFKHTHYVAKGVCVCWYWTQFEPYKVTSTRNVFKNKRVLFVCVCVGGGGSSFLTPGRDNSRRMQIYSVGNLSRRIFSFFFGGELFAPCDAKLSWLGAEQYSNQTLPIFPVYRP